VPASFLALHLLLAALAVGLPVALLRARPRGARALLLTAVLGGVPLQTALLRWPWLLARPGWPDAVFVSDVWVELALLVATAGAVAQPAGRARVRTALFGLVLVGVAARATTLPLRAPRPLTAPVRVKDGVVLQGAPSSCAAAAAATLVRALGVDPTATEADLARLSLTRPERGTSDLGLYRGLSLACPGRRVRFAWPGLDGLRARTTPCILFVGLDPSRVQDPLRSVLRDQCGWTEGVEHAVVLFRLDGQGAEIGEPRLGRERWPLEHFVALWGGEALVVE
jgi:hypothetical protein